MHKVIIIVAAVLFLALTFHNVFAGDSKPFMSRQDLEKSLQEKDAEIKKLKDELSALRAELSALRSEKNSSLGEKSDNDVNSNSNKGNGTRKNPANIGDVITVDVDRSCGRCTVEVELLEVIAGSKALRIIKAANSFNFDPPAGKEYVMAKFRVKNIKDLTGKDEALELHGVIFEYADNDDKILDARSPVASVLPDIKAKLFEGSENIGWTFFLSNTEEKGGKVVFEYEKDMYVWFNLSLAKSHTEVGSQTSRSDKGDVTVSK